MASLLSVPIFPHLWWLLVASFLIECNSLFWIPAKEASIPNLVPRNLLESANKLNLVTTYGFGAVAAAAVRGGCRSSTALLAHNLSRGSAPTRSNLALYIDALTFLVSALTIVNLRQIQQRRGQGMRSTADGSSGEQVGLMRLDHVRGWSSSAASALAEGPGARASAERPRAGAAVIGLSQRFAAVLQGGRRGVRHVVRGGVRRPGERHVPGSDRLIGTFSRRRVGGARDRRLRRDAVGRPPMVPNLALAIVTTVIMGFWAGLVWVVALTLVGSEVSDELRGRTFAFVYNLMRLVLLVMVVAAPRRSRAGSGHTS